MTHRPQEFSYDSLNRVAHANTSLSEIPVTSQIRIKYTEPLRKTNNLPYRKLRGFKNGHLNIASLFEHFQTHAKNFHARPNI